MFKIPSTRIKLPWSQIGKKKRPEGVTVYHFANAAARSAAVAKHGKIILNEDVRADMIKSKSTNPKWFKPVVVKKMMESSGEEQKTPRPRLAGLLVVGKHIDLTDFASNIVQLQQACPSGFRQPSTKAKNWGSTSLVEQLMIRAHQMRPPHFEGSARGNRKRDDDAYKTSVEATQGSMNIPLMYLHSRERKREKLRRHEETAKMEQAA